MTKTVDGRLEQISSKVNERLDEGFKKTNETFASVMARLAVIDKRRRKSTASTNGGEPAAGALRQVRARRLR